MKSFAGAFLCQLIDLGFFDGGQLPWCKEIGHTVILFRSARSIYDGMCFFILSRTTTKRLQIDITVLGLGMHPTETLSVNEGAPSSMMEGSRSQNGATGSSQGRDIRQHSTSPSMLTRGEPELC
jgi:hypothetical protein